MLTWLIAFGHQLETILKAQIKRAGGSLRTDVLMWLNRATLDIIGLAGNFFVSFPLLIHVVFTPSSIQISGFGYEFNALSDSEPSELSVVLAAMFKAGTTPFSQLQSAVPILRWVVRGFIIMIKFSFHVHPI
jgi:hypothetical protein